MFCLYFSVEHNEQKRSSFKMMKKGSLKTTLSVHST